MRDERVFFSARPQDIADHACHKAEEEESTGNEHERSQIKGMKSRVERMPNEAVRTVLHKTMSRPDAREKSKRRSECACGPSDQPVAAKDQSYSDRRRREHRPEGAKKE